MKVILCAGKITPLRLNAAVNCASGIPNETVALLPNNARVEGPEPLYCRLVTKTCYNRFGAFSPLKLSNAIDDLDFSNIDLLVVDSSSNTLALLDVNGDRCREIPFEITKRFFWSGPRPSVIIHFLPENVMYKSAKFWSQFITYQSVDTSFPSPQNDGMMRASPMIAEANAIWLHFHPWTKFRAKVRSRLQYLKFWKLIF